MLFTDNRLIGSHITLVPLETLHQGGLLEAASDGKLWELWFTSVPHESSIKAYIETALLEKEENRSFPFTIINRKTQKILGSSRFCNIDHNNRRLEIGYTWFAKSVQRTAINTESKLLMLSLAFDQLDCIAVEFRTHRFNQISRNAILRLGAKQDGILRNHRIDTEGLVRDTVVFSITQSEWPVVKKSLIHKLTKNPT